MEKNRLICIVTYLLWFVFVYMLTYNEQVTYSDLGIFILLNLLIQVGIIIVLKIKFYSIGILFVLIGQLFQFGHIILLAVGYEFTTFHANYQYERIDDRYIIEATVYALNCIIILFVGMLITIKPDKEYVKTEINQNSEIYRNVGKVLFYPGIVLFSILQLYNVYLIKESGVYSVSVYNSIPSTFVTLSMLMYVGIYFFMVAEKKIGNIIKARNWLWFAAVLAIISMLQGNRYNGMSVIIVLFSFYFVSIEKLTWKNIWKIIILGICLLSILNSLTIMRRFGFDLDLLLTGMVDSIKNIFFLTLEEFGVSIYVLAHKFEKSVRGIFEHNYFGIILHEFVLAIPGGESVFPELKQDGYEILGLKQLANTYIADIYYYCGKYGVSFIFVVGLWLGKIDSSYRKFASSGDYFSIGSRFIFYQLLMCGIRSNFRFGYKQFLLSIFIFWIIAKCMRIERQALEGRGKLNEN